MMIQVEHLHKSYGETQAIHDLCFSIEPGEVVGFLGPNGAGKTTTMRILAGAQGATSGRALINGMDVLENPLAVKRILGYLPEHPPLYTEMTVRNYLSFCAEIKGGTQAGVEEAIQRVGLSEVSHRLIQHLSKGFRQRVGIAQALVHRPKVLILDEPASGLDPAQRVEIRELVRSLADGNTTVILSTHVLPEVEAVCDRVIIIHKGKIVAEDTVDSLAQRSAHTTLMVARPTEALVTELQALPGVQQIETLDTGRFRLLTDGDRREQIAATAISCGLLELTSRQALESVFIELTQDPS